MTQIRLFFLFWVVMRKPFALLPIALQWLHFFGWLQIEVQRSDTRFNCNTL